MLRVKARYTNSGFGVTPKTRATRLFDEKVNEGDIVKINIIEPFGYDYSSEGSSVPSIKEELQLRCDNDTDGFLTTNKLHLQNPPKYIQRELSNWEGDYVILQIEGVEKSNETDINFTEDIVDSRLRNNTDIDHTTSNICPECEEKITDSNASYCRNCGSELKK